MTGRRRLRMLAATLVAPALAGALAVSPAAASATGSWRQRAEATDRALQQYFAAADGSGLYREEYPHESTDNTYSYEWPFSQEHVATLDLAAMAGSPDHRGALADRDAAQQHYWEDTSTTGLPGFASGAEPPYANGGDLFYDDNEWVGLEDVQHYAFFHDAASLAEARRIFALVRSGWDTDPSHADPGGTFWTQAPWSSDRNTVSNMPGAELGLRLFQLTGDRSYLLWSLRMYRWTNTYLQRPDGLYWDHVDLQGNVEKTIWSYNQGVPIGVDVLLFRITHQRSYLAEAERIAQASRAYFGTAGLDKQPPYFNSIYFKNLLLLQSVDHVNHRRQLAAYAERMWQTHRDPNTGLFHFAAAGDPHVQMIEQAAMTQIFAVLAWPPSDFTRLY
ncbi:MAG TPA: glycoside hydrolase family 76 protein [Jatrophihabitans sp.]